MFEFFMFDMREINISGFMDSRINNKVTWFDEAMCQSKWNTISLSFIDKIVKKGTQSHRTVNIRGVNISMLMCRNLC